MTAAVEERPSVNSVAGALAAIARGLMVEPIDLREFVREAWAVLEPAKRYVDNWHVDYICEHLTAVDQGQIRRLVVNIPPRMMKSILVSVLWPVWSWTERPWTRWVFASYAAALSVKHSVDRRDVINSEWYKHRWGSLYELADDQNLKTEFKNTERGFMIATSVGGTITGKGGDRIVIDDLLNPMEAESKAAREAANKFYANTLTTRLDDPKTGAIVVVMQRLHKEDLTGLVLREGGWTHLSIPAKAEHSHSLVFPLSGRVVERPAGHMMFADRYGDREWEGQRRAMGTRSHDAQVQQSPTSEVGDILKKHWWRFYDDVPDGFDLVLQSWDLAFGDSDGGSFVVGQVWGLRGSRKYLLDQFRDHVDYPGTKRAIESMTARWPMANMKLVENKANGPAILSDLGQTIPGMIPVSPMGDKVQRASAIAPTVEAGDVYLPSPERAPWVTAFIDECGEFPNGSNDDQVDTASQAITRLNEIVSQSLLERDDASASENFLEGGMIHAEEDA